MLKRSLSDYFATTCDTKKFFVAINVNFKLRKNKNADGTMPIIIYVTGGGERERINPQINVEPKYFDEKKQRMKPINPRFIDINLMIDHLQSKIFALQTEYRLADKTLTPKLLRQELNDGSSRINFVAFIERCLEDEKSLRSRGTYLRYVSLCKTLKAFSPDIPFSTIDRAWFNKYRAWCLAEGNTRTTINGKVILLKKFLRIAASCGVRLAVNLDDVEGGSTHGNRTWLNVPELVILFKYFHSEFISRSDKIVLGYFLFSCMTGLRISDVQNLSRKDLLQNEVSFINTKSKADQFMILNMKAREVLLGCEDLFITKFVDQVLNREIKKIVKACGITKSVSYHVSRHTFATCFIRAKGSILDLRILLKHKDINTTMIYAHIIEEEANEEVYRLDGLF